MLFSPVSTTTRASSTISSGHSVCSGIGIQAGQVAHRLEACATEHCKPVLEEQRRHPAPHAFKGFADQTSTAPPTCGGTWTTDPGNSSGPPASVPSFMAVIVSNSVTKSGATISGDVPKIVIVQTNPGYAPDPGHPGTGTVVAVLCGS